MNKILAAVLLFALSFHASAAQWQMLASREYETVIYFFDVDRKMDTHTLLWVKTVFTNPKSVAIEGKTREIIKNHSLTMSAWDIDCTNKSGKLVSTLAYTTDGTPIKDYRISTFASDFLGFNAKPLYIVEITHSRQLSGDLKNLLIDRACQGAL